MTVHRISRSQTSVAPPIALVGLIVLTIAFALQGFGGALAALTGMAPAGLGPTIGQPFGTSFGTVTVEDAQVIDGLTAGDMWNGMSHGVGGIVEPGDAKVAVSVSLFNDAGHAVAVGPGMFGLVVGDGQDALAPVAATIQPLRLRPGSRLDGTVAFIVRLGGDAMAVSFTDPGSGTVTLVPIEVRGRPPAGDAHGNPH